MSDKKISQLTAATTADGTEPLPIVQSGETKKATGKVVVSGAVSDLAQTWNAAGTTFTGLKLNVTDTASASGSLLLDVQKGGTSQLVLNKSGYLGLGVTPSAWGATYVPIQVGPSSALVDFTSGANVQTNLLNNLYLAAGNSFTYLTSAAASAYRQIAGVHQWSTAPSGTAAVAATVTERMRLDNSGNLGLGVTPSAWAFTKAVEVSYAGTALMAFSANNSILTSNAYYGTNWTYAANATASYYQQLGGSHTWVTAPSGTAGSAITFTERATIGLSSFVVNDPGNDYDFRIEGDTDANLVFVDASTDRVGIGTNAPAYKLDVRGTLNAYNPAATTTNPFANILLRLSSNGSGTGGAINFTDGVAYNAYIGMASGSLRFACDDTIEKMRLDVSGNLGLGTSTFGTSAAGVFAVKNGTAPTTGVADVLQIYSSDVSAGNTTLSIYTEGTPVSDSTDNAVTKKIAVRINGTLYYLLADTDNS